MESQLPTEFDLVVIGTGMVESVVSAAASRIGKRVLHIDRNDYYGTQWASFNLKTIHNFTRQTQNFPTEITDGCVSIGNDIFNVQNVVTKFHIPENKTAVPSLDDLTISNEGEHTTDSSKVNDITEVQSNADKVEVTNLKEPTQRELLSNSRKFNIDLVPKLHFARGEFVELLISSNIARYAEYRSVSRVLTYLNGQLEVVPCSRSDVFSTNRISVIEKRMLMKLLTSLNESEDSIINDSANVTFKKFLIDRKLPENLVHFILYAMSRSTDETSVSEGILGTKRFLNSLGRFGKTPFLFSMYGSGETTQAFCRLSAVFGGVFALNQHSLAGLRVENNKVIELLNSDQKIKADHFVINAELAPKTFVECYEVKEYIARAVLITDRSIMESEQEHLTLLIYPTESGKNIITVVEMGALTGTCPKGYFLVHFTAKQVTQPQEDFEHIINKLFAFQPCDELSPSKPRVLWSCFFSLPFIHDLDCVQTAPENLYICEGPDLDLDYDGTIAKAKNIFHKMYPDLEFLPRAPDPEEIIIGDENSEQIDNLSKET